LKDEKYFLPYQISWLKDKSDIKVWEKSRRIGATYVQSYEDVSDCASGRVPAVWFSSADESAAREYIEYAEKWTKLFNNSAENFGQQMVDSERNLKAFVIEFANGTKIHALSSNPKTFRSKGGKVVLDEFAWHEDQDRMWRAARPVITWGFPLRILSSHNGQSGRFYRFTEGIKKEKLKWSLHTTTIFDAVNQGLLDRILCRATTIEERTKWLQEQRQDCFDEETWLQEYCCIPIDETTAFLTYGLIETCELDDVVKPLEDVAGDLYIGMDIGRKKDLSVIWVVERLGRVMYTRAVKILEKTPFHFQREALFELLKHRRFRRICIDATGLGMQLAEEALIQFGKYRVEAITFTSRVKEELAYNLRTNFEDRTVYIPSDHAIREDLHSVRKITTTSGHIRFDVNSSEKSNSHADRFWALALALHACKEEAGPVQILSSRRRESYEILRGYW
jgi:phage FluMu gp28-like protein